MQKSSKLLKNGASVSFKLYLHFKRINAVFLTLEPFLSKVVDFDNDGERRCGSNFPFLRIIARIVLTYSWMPFL